MERSRNAVVLKRRVNERVSPRTFEQEMVRRDAFGARRFPADERLGKLKLRLSRILKNDDTMREFVRAALPSLDEHEKALQALRFIMGGFSFAHAGRECGVPTTTITGWWRKFEDELRKWKAKEECGVRNAERGIGTGKAE